jgi:hypothetical protein
VHFYSAGVATHVRRIDFRAQSYYFDFHNATDSLARFENKNILFYFEKRSSLPTTTLAL